jgi:hypothetical protein
MIGQCANRACSRPFDCLAGGKFFRFVAPSDASLLSEDTMDGVGNLHQAQHYWLCQDCARAFSLVYADGAGVVLQPRFMEFPIAKIFKRVAAA